MRQPLPASEFALSTQLHRLEQAECHLLLNHHRLLAPLMGRLRASVAAHRQYTTIRREDCVWEPLAPRVQVRHLRRDGMFSIALWRLEANRPLPWPADALGMEILVVAGRLCTAPGDAIAPTLAHDHCVVSAPAQVAGWFCAEPTTLYVRQRLVPLHALPDLEAHWWELAATWTEKHQSECQPLQQQKPGGRRWVQTAPGVEVQLLSGDRQVVSMLLRIAAGATVSDHAHALDEDCLVLDGEVFLGDTLLRAGDYQLAPHGGSHFGEMSDVGVTLYFHGAIDPRLHTAKPHGVGPLQ